MNRIITTAAIAAALLAGPAVSFAEPAELNPTVLTIPAESILAANPSAGLHRTLASVMLLKRLNLTTDQKGQLTSLLTQAKAQRAARRAELAANDTLKTQRELLLQKAIDEARVSGEVSSSTRAQLTSLRSGMSEMRAERKAQMEQIKALFTPDQLAALRPAQDGAKAHRRGHSLRRILMSDEFSAELAR